MNLRLMSHQDRKSARRAMELAIAAAAFFTTAAVVLAHPGFSESQRAALRELEQRSTGQVEVSVREQAGTPRQIRVSNGVLMSAAAGSAHARGDVTAATAAAFLEAHKEILGLSDPTSELMLKTRKSNEDGRTSMRYAQRFDGLAVWPAELIVNLDTDGNVEALSGAFTRTPDQLSTTPTLGSEKAEALARIAVAADDAELESSELIIYNGDDGARLAYKLELHASLSRHMVVVIDAHTGAAISAFNTVCTAHVNGSGLDLRGQTQQFGCWQENGAYYMINSSKPMFDGSVSPTDVNNARGAIIILDSQNTWYDQGGRLVHVTSNTPDSWTIPDAVSAAAGLSQTYDYYLAAFNRNALDGRGGSMRAIVRYGQGFQNAFWNPQANVMVFGDGLPFAGALDVIAHELTHGVTSNESDLVYQQQSGALNEAMSDIFGEVVEAYVRGQCDWKKGADMNSVMQDYANPNSVSQFNGIPNPANMSQYINTSEDNGGVHLNSSIINHCFYLLAQGMQDSIGINNAAAIFYRANTNHLTQNSQFVDCRLACILAADEIFGAGSMQSQATARAFDTVQIFGNGSPVPNPTPNPIPNGADDQFEDNDSPEQAAQLFAGASGLVCNDDDWFFLDIVQGGRLPVEVIGDGGDLDLYVFDAAGNLLGSGESEGSYESVQVEVGAGRVYILVYPYDGMTAGYTLAISGDTGRTPEPAPTPNPGPTPTPFPSPAPTPSPFPSPAPTPNPGPVVEMPVTCGAGGASFMMASLAGLIGVGAAGPKRRRK
ncbi:MAG: M4 family metallopeptidase [Phycisphaerae bacterium]|nr:M4 family metallopeptidase [Phycisphaerae bacterium]